MRRERVTACLYLYTCILYVFVSTQTYTYVENWALKYMSIIPACRRQRLKEQLLKTVLCSTASLRPAPDTRDSFSKGRNEKRGERKEGIGEGGERGQTTEALLPLPLKLFCLLFAAELNPRSSRGVGTFALADLVKLCPTTSVWHIPCTYCSVNNFREPDPARSFTQSLWKGQS